MLSIKNSSIAQEKKINNKESKNSEVIKVTGHADTALLPSYAELMIKQMITGDDVNEKTLQNPGQDLKELLDKIGIDNTKLQLGSINNISSRIKNSNSYAMCSYTLRVIDLSKLSELYIKLAEKDYSVISATPELNDSIIKDETIKKSQLSKAIKNGKEKANQIANELGIKTLKLISLEEIADSKNSKTENINFRDKFFPDKIKLEKEVLMIYQKE
jgi:uncharacterized protein YggE